ncbi:hypothetical protein NLI96_g9935 [Meripilus lineatus]|uniref:Thiaminase-2/PQQC domain-containing protein n=1 Tax=Meripilus lineatus TaxID=2056292 RepID=A0AAD5UUJ1_9APHY|nr:hypothetical protein NLI96_g9935 [Physisporinus lineatus]
MPEKSTLLTAHLRSLPTVRPYSAATEHEFLASAGKGTLSADRLALYLSQDRLYAAHAYPIFMGQLLAAINFSSLHARNSTEEKSNQRIVKVVSDALQNVIREVGFFDEVAEKFGLEVDGWRERKATRDYTAEMGRLGATGTVQDMLVFLWAMERVYLDSWRFVASHTSTAKAESDVSEAVAWLVSNWTNPDFVVFVDTLGDIVDALEISPLSDAGKRAEEIWARVLELEEAFWPLGEDELTLLRKQ